jgi:hypothetical protein
VGAHQDINVVKIQKPLALELAPNTSTSTKSVIFFKSPNNLDFILSVAQVQLNQYKQAPKYNSTLYGQLDIRKRENITKK